MNLNVMRDPLPFAAEIQAVDTTLVIRLVGELDLPATDILRDTVTAEVANGAANVWVDLAGLDFCDGSGIRALLDLQRRLANGRRRTVTFHGPSRLTSRLLDITGADRILNLAPTEEATG